jgi:hypothetical protein
VINQRAKSFATGNGFTPRKGYFDHRLGADERGTQMSAKMKYIRQNPVAPGLCTRAEDWPWVIDPFVRKSGSSCPQVEAG